MELPWLSQRRYLAAGLVALAAALVYLNGLTVPFLNWDDTYYVTQSARAQMPGWKGFLNVWSSDDIWLGRFLEFFPLRDTVYWVLFQLFGLNPVPFHVANVLAHVAAAVLVWVLARRMGFSPPVAFGGALLFAVHPIHVESVTWVAGLKDPLFTALCLGSLIVFLRYRASLRPVEYGVSVVLFVGALLCKSLALPVPLLMLAMDRLLEGRPSWRVSLMRVGGPAVISGIFFVQFVLMGRLSGVLTPPHGGTWFSHFFLSGWAFVRYLQQSVAPTSFALHYCFFPPAGVFDPRGVLIVLALVGVAVALVLSLRRAPLVAILVVWFCAALAPVANLVPFPAIMADRYLYLPSVASCLALAWGLWKLPVRLRLPLLLACAGVFAAATVARNVTWRSEAALWAEVAENPACRVDDQPTSAVVFFKHAAFQKEPAAALAAYSQGIEHPAFSSLHAGDRCFYFGAAAEASMALREPARARGFADRAVVLCPWLASAWRTLMLVSARTQPEVARDAALRAYRLSPTPASAWHLGHARLGAGDTSGVEDIVSAVTRAPERFCGPFLRWAAQPSVSVTPERLTAARGVCAGR